MDLKHSRTNLRSILTARDAEFCSKTKKSLLKYAIVVKFTLTFIKDYNAYIESILKMFNKYTYVVHTVFNNDPLFLLARDAGSRKFINDNSKVSVTSIC